MKDTHTEKIKIVICTACIIVLSFLLGIMYDRIFLNPCGEKLDALYSAYYEKEPMIWSETGISINGHPIELGMVDADTLDFSVIKCRAKGNKP